MTAVLSFDPATAVSADRRAQIEQALTQIAAEEGVRVLLAVESGSRAWGFHSPDSDYDVRFIYARPVRDYLGLEPKRDVIERPIDDDLDLAGWDIAKALKLASRGNAVISEWMSSPIVYAETEGFRDAFAPIGQAWRSEHGDIAHYYGLARRQWGKFIEGREQVRLKKYFYVIRPACALHWLREGPGGQPPMNLPELLTGITLPATTAEALTELRERKQAAGEGVGVGDRIPAIDDYLRAQLDWALAEKPAPKPRDPVLWAKTEDLFRTLIRAE